MALTGGAAGPTCQPEEEGRPVGRKRGLEGAAGGSPACGGARERRGELERARGRGRRFGETDEGRPGCIFIGPGGGDRGRDARNRPAMRGRRRGRSGAVSAPIFVGKTGEDAEEAVEGGGRCRRWRRHSVGAARARAVAGRRSTARGGGRLHGGEVVPMAVGGNGVEAGGRHYSTKPVEAVAWSGGG